MVVAKLGPASVRGGVLENIPEFPFLIMVGFSRLGARESPYPPKRSPRRSSPVIRGSKVRLGEALRKPRRPRPGARHLVMPARPFPGLGMPDPGTRPGHDQPPPVVTLLLPFLRPSSTRESSPAVVFDQCDGQTLSPKAERAAFVLLCKGKSGKAQTNRR